MGDGTRAGCDGGGVVHLAPGVAAIDFGSVNGDLKITAVNISRIGSGSYRRYGYEQLPMAHYSFKAD